MNLRMLVCAMAILGTLGPGCNYGAITVAPDGRVLVARNDHILFGSQRLIFVCDLEEAGLVNCTESTESP